MPRTSYTSYISGYYTIHYKRRLYDSTIRDYYPPYRNYYFSYKSYYPGYARNDYIKLKRAYRLPPHQVKPGIDNP